MTLTDSRTEESAQAWVLGCMLIHPSIIGEVAGMLTAEDFTTPGYDGLFKTLCRMSSQRETIDGRTVVRSLRRARLFEQIGGADGFMRVLDSVGAAANWKTYAKMVLEDRLAVKATQAGQSLIHAIEQGKRPAEALNLASEEISKLLVTEDATVLSARDAVKLHVDDIQAAWTDGQPRLTPTGIPMLDEAIIGMGAGRVTIVAARPFVGKSTMGLNIALNVAESGLGGVVLFSLELSPIEIAANLQAMSGGVQPRTMYRGRVAAETEEKWSTACMHVAGLPMTIIDNPRITAAGIGAVVKTLAKRRPVNMVIIDYLQLLEVPKAERREREIAATTREIKLLSRELDTHFLVMSQLNRSSEKDNRPPRLSDLRESGAIEQDADSVWFLHRPCMNLSAEEIEKSKAAGKRFEDDYAILMIRKNRVTGWTSDVEVTWNKQKMRFGEETEQ